MKLLQCSTGDISFEFYYLFLLIFKIKKIYKPRFEKRESKSMHGDSCGAWQTRECCALLYTQAKANVFDFFSMRTHGLPTEVISGLQLNLHLLPLLEPNKSGCRKLLLLTKLGLIHSRFRSLFY